jgi:hypothetical protein
MAEGDGACIGRGGSRCRFRPVVIVAGDPACAYHVGTVVRMRLREVGAPVVVSLAGEEG